MSRGRWREESRAKRLPFTANQYEALITGVRCGNSWDDIADACGATEQICQHIAKGMGLIHPNHLHDSQLREMGLMGADERESPQQRDNRYVAALLAAGGFCYAVIENGKTIWVWPEGRQASAA